MASVSAFPAIRRAGYLIARDFGAVNGLEPDTVDRVTNEFIAGRGEAAAGVSDRWLSGLRPGEL